MPSSANQRNVRHELLDLGERLEVRVRPPHGADDVEAARGEKVAIPEVALHQRHVRVVLPSVAEHSRRQVQPCTVDVRELRQEVPRATGQVEPACRGADPVERLAEHLALGSRLSPVILVRDEARVVLLGVRLVV
jgi:hypothetical protein